MMKHETMKEMLTHYNKLELSTGDYLNSRTFEQVVNELINRSQNNQLDRGVISNSQLTSVYTVERYVSDLIEEYKAHKGERCATVLLYNPTTAELVPQRVWESNWVEFCHGKSCTFVDGIDSPIFKPVTEGISK